MITVCEKGKCTGGMECIDICPKGAVQVVDSMIEYNAIINEGNTGDEVEVVLEETNISIGDIQILPPKNKKMIKNR